MASNYAQVQTSDGHPPSTTTLQEKKLRWIEKQMKKKREQAMKVRNKISRDGVYKLLIFINRTLHQTWKQRKIKIKGKTWMTSLL